MTNKNNKLVEHREVILSERPPFPNNVMIELTNSCNHACIFCGYKEMRRKRKMCDVTFVERIIKESYQYGAMEIGFYLIGEPFLCSDFSKFVSLAKKIGYKYIYVTTNGAEASKDKLKEIIKSGIDSIKFSVNAATKDTYKKIHGKDDYEKVKSNISWLRRYLDENSINVKTFISFVKCNYNANEVELIKHEYENLVDNIYIYECGNQGGNMIDLMREGVVDKVINGKAPCDMVFNRLHVTVEGYLDACCADINGNLVVADLHDMTIYDAWYSESMINLRRQHLNGFTENNLCNICVNNIDEEVVPLKR